MKYELANAKEVLKWRIAKAEETKYFPLYRLSCALSGGTIHLYSVLKPEGDIPLDIQGDNIATWSNDTLQISNYSPSLVCDMSNTNIGPKFLVYSQEAGDFNTGNTTGNKNADLSTLDLVYGGSGSNGYYLAVKENGSYVTFTYDYDNDDIEKCYYYMTYDSAGSYQLRVYFNDENLDLTLSGGYYTAKVSTYEYFYPVNYLVGYNGWTQGTSDKDMRCKVYWYYDGSGESYYLNLTDYKDSTSSIADIPYFNNNPKLVEPTNQASILKNNVYLNNKNELYCNVNDVEVYEASETVSGTVKASENSENYYGVYLNNNMLNLCLASTGTSKPGGIMLNGGTTEKESRDYYIYSSYSDDYNTVVNYVIVDAPYDINTGSLKWKAEPKVDFNILGAFSCTIANTDILITECLKDVSYERTSDGDYIIYVGNSSESASYIRSDNIYKKILENYSLKSLNYNKLMFMQKSNGTGDYYNIGFTFGEWPTDDGWKSGSTTERGRINTDIMCIMPRLSVDSSAYHTKFIDDFILVTSEYDYNAESQLRDADSGLYPLNSGDYISTENNSAYKYSETIYDFRKDVQTYNEDGKQYVQIEDNSKTIYVDLNNYYTKDEIGDLNEDLAALFESKLNS